MRARRGLLAAITAASVLALPVVVPLPAGAEADPGLSRSAGTPATEPDLGASGTAVDVAAIKRHLEQLQKIADANGGTRASGTPGHEASVTYVAGLLRSAGYQVTLQEFEFPFFRDITEPTLKRVSTRGQDLRAQGRLQDHDLLRIGERHGSRARSGPGPAAVPEAEFHLAAARRATSPGSPRGTSR